MRVLWAFSCHCIYTRCQRALGPLPCWASDLPSLLHQCTTASAVLRLETTPNPTITTRAQKTGMGPSFFIGFHETQYFFGHAMPICMTA